MLYKSADFLLNAIDEEYMKADSFKRLSKLTRIALKRRDSSILASLKRGKKDDATKRKREMKMNEKRAAVGDEKRQDA
jgi:hypothetical protein